MIDEGETDWKIICIDVNDELASSHNLHTDINQGKLKEVFTFLRDYKIPAGKPANKFAYDGALLDKNFSTKVTERNHHEWLQLMQKKIVSEKIQTVCTDLDASTYTGVVSAQEAAEIFLKHATQYLQSKM